MPSVNGVEALPDGRVLSGGQDGTVKMWALNGMLERVFDIEDWVTCVAALPDGVHFVIGLRGHGEDDDEEEVGEIRLYRVDGTLVHAFTAHPLRVSALAVTLDGQHKNTFKLHTHEVFALAALPDNRHALSAGDDTAKLFNVNDGAVLRNFTHHNLLGACMALMPDGLRFVSGSGDLTARIIYHGLAPQ